MYKIVRQTLTYPYKKIYKQIQKGSPASIKKETTLFYLHLTHEELKNWNFQIYVDSKKI